MSGFFDERTFLCADVVDDDTTPKIPCRKVRFGLHPLNAKAEYPRNVVYFPCFNPNFSQNLFYANSLLFCELSSGSGTAAKKNAGEHKIFM